MQYITTYLLDKNILPIFLYANDKKIDLYLSIAYSRYMKHQRMVNIDIIYLYGQKIYHQRSAPYQDKLKMWCLSVTCKHILMHTIY